MPPVSDRMVVRYHSRLALVCIVLGLFQANSTVFQTFSRSQSFQRKPPFQQYFMKTQSTVWIKTAMGRFYHITSTLLVTTHRRLLLPYQPLPSSKAQKDILNWKRSILSSSHTATITGTGFTFKNAMVSCLIWKKCNLYVKAIKTNTTLNVTKSSCQVN